MRFTPGALWLGLRQTFGHGINVAWYRDVVRPQIMTTGPVVGTTDTRCEIHVLTSKGDWLNLLWTLKSFYYMSRRRYALCIHEDGTLADGEISALATHFPHARIIRRSTADATAEQELRNFPRSLEFRRTNLLAPKLFDFAIFLEGERMAVFDSDLLFFDEPRIFLQRVEDKGYQRNTFNADCGDAYTVDASQVPGLVGHKLVPRVNSGFGLVHRGSICWEWIEEFLGLPGILDGHFWRIEQTLFALCSSRYGVDLLPDEYTVDLHGSLNRKPFRHYVGAIRHLMYSEGIPRLTQAGLLRNDSAMLST